MSTSKKDQIKLEEAYSRVQLVREDLATIGALVAGTITAGLGGLYHYLKAMSQEQLEKLFDNEFKKDIEDAIHAKKMYDYEAKRANSDGMAQWGVEHHKLAQKIEQGLHEHGYNLKLSQIENHIENSGL